MINSKWNGLSHLNAICLKEKPQQYKINKPFKKNPFCSQLFKQEVKAVDHETDVAGKLMSGLMDSGNILIVYVPVYYLSMEKSKQIAALWQGFN